MNETERDIIMECLHNNLIKSFLWHRKLKYWVCIKSPNKNDLIKWQQAPPDIGRYLTHTALEKNILTKNDLNLFKKEKTKKYKKTIIKPKNFIPLF